MFYIISIVVFLCVFALGFNGTGTKALVLKGAGLLFALIDLIVVWSGCYTDIGFFNVLLSVIPVAMLLLCALFLMTGKEATPKAAPKTASKSTHQPIYQTKIVDNELSSVPPAVPVSPVVSGTPAATDGKLQYSGAPIADYGTCDVEETEEYIKITMHEDGKDYAFYFKDGNIECYRFTGMGSNTMNY